METQHLASIRCQGMTLELVERMHKPKYVLKQLQDRHMTTKTFQTLRQSLRAMLGDHISAEEVLLIWLCTDVITRTVYDCLQERLKKESPTLPSDPKGDFYKHQIEDRTTQEIYDCSLNLRLATADEIKQHNSLVALSRAWIVQDATIPTHDRIFANYEDASLYYSHRRDHYQWFHQNVVQAQAQGKAFPKAILIGKEPLMQLSEDEYIEIGGMQTYSIQREGIQSYLLKAHGKVVHRFTSLEACVQAITNKRV